MKLKIAIRALLLCVFSGAIFSCSEDDSPPSCRATEISMKINGELHTFTTAGRGIDIIWETGQYDFDLDFYGDPEDYLSLNMLYKKTGHNVIDELTLSRFDEAHNGEYSLISDDFDSHVRINRSSCFYATFSGKFMADGEEMTVTDGIISWEYDEPFDE